MNKKIIIISLAITIIILSTVPIIDYYETKKSDEGVKNADLVVNCVPVGPNQAIPTLLIKNSTHQFDLGKCIWNPIK